MKKTYTYFSGKEKKPEQSRKGRGPQVVKMDGLKSEGGWRDGIKLLGAGPSSQRAGSCGLLHWEGALPEPASCPRPSLPALPPLGVHINMCDGS